MNKRYTRRYTYSSRCDISSVGMDSHKFVARETALSIQCMTAGLHNIIYVSQHLFNLTSVNLGKIFNHCIVLIYYAGEVLKEKTFIGYHNMYITYQMESM